MSSLLQLSQTQWKLSQRHITLLNVIACAAFKRAAKSLEKLMDVTREELPDTMAAMRLSGMEINDLTMDLSDLGWELLVELHLLFRCSYTKISYG
ncbi:Transmembrane protein [Quillaja saponaria]|uniref:Transmembrane protein n=1 Tax=Quillaja saponaria TaxID=32244 RepID=A0AAD7LEV6_QUISA|nr:Transmembrane protein [Quillaja saponaria]